MAGLTHALDQDLAKVIARSGQMSRHLLRRVCDDYPGSGEYSHAHRYLQAELGVTYTGGKRKEK